MGTLALALWPVVSRGLAALAAAADGSHGRADDPHPPRLPRTEDVPRMAEAGPAAPPSLALASASARAAFDAAAPPAAAAVARVLQLVALGRHVRSAHAERAPRDSEDDGAMVLGILGRTHHPTGDPMGMLGPGGTGEGRAFADWRDALPPSHRETVAAATPWAHPFADPALPSPEHVTPALIVRARASVRAQTGIDLPTPSAGAPGCSRLRRLDLSSNRLLAPEAVAVTLGVLLAAPLLWQVDLSDTEAEDQAAGVFRALGDAFPAEAPLLLGPAR